jgi:hypothetical protein
VQCKLWEARDHGIIVWGFNQGSLRRYTFVKIL